METVTLDPPPEGEAPAPDSDGGEPRRPSLVGRVIAGKYQLVRLLGEGGMGAVYEAMHLLIERRVAIKFVHGELAWRSDVTTRFSREARAAGSLDSENIAAVTDFGTDADGRPFLVMEYLVGTDLAHLLLSHGPLPVPRACHLLVQACRGLAIAHAKGIVHRDLKPDNLFVTKRADGTDLLKILDFGIAKLQHQDAQNATQTGSAMGTAYYMPPEQVRGARTLDHRADIYALGVIAYELLSATKPHTGESYTDVLFHVISEKPIPLSTHRPGLPEDLVALVAKAMSFEAEDRFQSVEDLRDALVPFVGGAITPVEAYAQGSALSTARLSSPNAETAAPPPNEALSPAPRLSLPSISSRAGVTSPTQAAAEEVSSLPDAPAPAYEDPHEDAPAIAVDRRPVWALAGVLGLLFAGLVLVLVRGGSGERAIPASTDPGLVAAATAPSGSAGRVSVELSARTSADTDAPPAISPALASVSAPVSASAPAPASDASVAAKTSKANPTVGSKPPSAPPASKKRGTRDLYAP